MKKKIHKIWGVGLVLVLAASLLLSAAPVSAGELDWGTFTPFPSTTGNVLQQNNNYVSDIAVAEDGVMYLASTNSTFLYKSTNGGRSWSKLSENFSVNLTFVAVAPDDSDIVAASSDNVVWISKDGGSSWGSLGKPDDIDTLETITDLAVSNADGSKNYIGVSGNTTSANASAWWFDLGATAPSWSSADAGKGFDTATNTANFSYAVAFSPNVASDKVMLLVTSNATHVWLQMMSLSTEKWNSNAGFDSYPAEIQDSSTSIDGISHARIATAPDYLGSDDSMRVCFVGITATGSDGGIYRMKDTTDKAIDDDFNVWSIDYDGTNVVAGATDDNKVRRSDNPLATEPDFSTASAYKRPGGQNKIVVAFNGSDVVAGSQGKMSSFAMSTDNGASFNDVSFIDTVNGTLGTMLDVEVSEDGEMIYMLTQDTKGLSLWRYDGSSWVRVFTKSGAGDSYIVRIAPDDPDAVFLSMAGSTNSTTLYYSQAGGDTKWFLRAAKYAIQDLAVESGDVAYAAVFGASTVSKTSNSGFTWDTAESTGITGDINMIRSLGEDMVIIGSDAGYVGYSSDGNDSWTTISTRLNAAGNTQVTASGLSDGDFIYAATDTAAKRVERWEIGQSGTSWKNLEAPLSDARSVYGIALVEGVLYAQTDNGTVAATLRTIEPTTGEPSSGKWSTMSEAGPAFTRAPQALKVSMGSTMLWSISANTSALYAFEDTLATAGPTLSAPADGATIEINPVSGLAFAIPLTWKRPSKATIYDYQIATDSSFNEKLVDLSTASTTADTPGVVIASGTVMPETTYYWRVRVNIAGPVKSPWSATRMMTVGTLPEVGGPPVVIEQPPAPVIAVPPTPEITITAPEITIPAPEPVPSIVIPAPPAAPAPITPAYIWAIIIIGAILVIAVIVLIVRTRRPV